MLSHYAWPGGLAFVIETPRRRFAAILEPSGWRLGDAREVWRAGPPSGATMAALELPPWLERQLPSLDLTQRALHTDFVRLNRVLARMQSERANGAVVVLGPQPAAFVLTGGAPVVIYPTGRDGEHADMVAARAVGWVCVMSGQVVLGGAEDEPEPLIEPAPSLASDPYAAGSPAEVALQMAAPQMAAPQVEAPQPEPVAVNPPTRVASPMPGEPATAPAPTATPAGFQAGDRFVAAAGARTLSHDAVGQVAAVAGDRGRQIVELLDGSRTIQEVADAVAVAPEQVGQVVRILVSAKLAFRYVSRVRPATGARSPG